MAANRKLMIKAQVWGFGPSLSPCLQPHFATDKLGGYRVIYDPFPP